VPASIWAIDRIGNSNNILRMFMTNDERILV